MGGPYEPHKLPVHLGCRSQAASPDPSERKALLPSISFLGSQETLVLSGHRAFVYPVPSVWNTHFLLSPTHLVILIPAELLPQGDFPWPLDQKEAHHPFSWHQYLPTLGSLIKLCAALTLQAEFTSFFSLLHP
jgi:hypothetical protein